MDRRRRLPPTRWIVATVVLIVAGWATFVGWSLVKAHTEIEAGRNAVRSVQGLTMQQFVDGQANDGLATAEQRFASAAGRLRHPAVWPTRWLPWAGRQLRSVTALTTAAQDATRLARSAIVALDDAVGDGVPAGADRLAVLADVAATAAELRDGLEHLDLGPETALVGRLAAARTEFEREIDELTTRLDTLVDVGTGVSDLLEGPHRYLVFAANNAQMQNGQGMFLEWAVLETSAGRLSLSEFRSVSDLPAPPQPITLDPDLAAAWPWLDPNADWRHLGTTARFPVTAATAQALWAATGQTPVDGVVSIDAVALRALLGLTGPVVVDGTTIAPESVEAYLLHDQYTEFFGAGPTTAERQRAREMRLRAIAGAALTAVDGGNGVPLNLSTLTPVGETLQQRHLLAWSSIPSQQAAFEAAGIDGSVPADGLLVSVVNRSAAKLDWFLDVGADVHVDPATPSQVSLTVRLRNTVDPSVEPNYVAGPYEDGLARGQYLGVVTATMPGAATGVTVDGAPVVVAGADGDSSLYGARVLVDPGGEATVVFHFQVDPAVLDHLTLQPSGRVHPVEWSLDGEPPPAERIPLDVASR